jgi:peptidyl-tRNA hydrolase, PTH2 family
MKQVILVNEALKLPKGKLAAQVAHASLQAYLCAPVSAQQAWSKVGMPKVILRCDSATDLLDIETRALQSGLPAALLRDAGRTVVEAGTITCLGLGPADTSVIDTLTGSLKLVK